MKMMKARVQWVNLGWIGQVLERMFLVPKKHWFLCKQLAQRSGYHGCACQTGAIRAISFWPESTLLKTAGTKLNRGTHIRLGWSS